MTADRPRACALALGLMACSPAPAESQSGIPGPEPAQLPFVKDSGVAHGYVMVGQLGDLDARVGLSVVCGSDGSQGPGSLFSVLRSWRRRRSHRKRTE